MPNVAITLLDGFGFAGSPKGRYTLLLGAVGIYICYLQMLAIAVFAVKGGVHHETA
jgi:hypothetical protein